jgi:hypothetical protein
MTRKMRSRAGVSRTNFTMLTAASPYYGESPDTGPHFSSSPPEKGHHAQGDGHPVRDALDVRLGGRPRF